MAARFSASRRPASSQLGNSPNQLAIMARNLANALALHEMGASWDGPPIPLRRRYLRIPMGHWPFRPGCPCPKCPKMLDERSEVGWCIMCGSFGCSWCCSVVEYRIKHLRTSAERAIGANWNCATWELLLRGRPCAPGWRTRAVLFSLLYCII